jgi:carbamoyl-phosphate synthase large subunit
MGFTIFSTGGTHQLFTQEGIPSVRVYKILEGARPHCVDLMKNNEIHFVINTPSSHESRADEVQIRAGAIANKISYATNLAAAEASVRGIRALQNNELTVRSIQEFHNLV